MAEKSLTEVDLAALCQREFHPSPVNWADEVLYFLMLDRFSDGKEDDFRDNEGQVVTTGTTPPFQPSDNGNATGTEADAKMWREAGNAWVGGGLVGLTSKIGYLKRLGVTCIWVSPLFKQVSFWNTYHGYGIQDFLDVDRHFGSRNDLRTMVETAHAHGIRVILDIILNHSGDVFAYDADRYETVREGSDETYIDPRWDGNLYDVKGFKDQTGAPVLPFGPVDLAVHPNAWSDGAIWPEQFQQDETFTRKGHISNWDYDPEFREADFHDLKDIALGNGTIDAYHPSAALNHLCEVYKFWIAFADVDGYRVDTVKHMDEGAARYFTSVIHEFAQSIGKERFYLIGEITGGREFAFDVLESTGMNAALGINEIPGRMESLVKGFGNPSEYFELFRNSLLVHKDSHVWFRDKVVTVLDDHDQVRKGHHKARFCALDPRWPDLMLAALALNTTTLGIPCIYYGSEQCFDGEGGSKENGGDRYLREAVFGGPFGPFRSRDRHCFNENATVYKELSEILALRRDKIALRRGRQYLRQISEDGQDFGLPHILGGRMRSIVPWSRIFNNHEMLLAINTDVDDARTAYVIVDASLNEVNAQFECLYSTDPAQIGQAIVVEKPGSDPNDPTKAVSLTVPAAGFVIYEQA